MAGAPTALRKGARITVVSPSGPVTDEAKLACGIQVLRDRGFEVEIVGPLTNKRAPEFLAGTDRQRAIALRRSLSDADAVWFSRGGYGAARLLSGSGWDGPGPWMIGFSDATSLLWARYARGVEGGVHGPVVNGLAVEPEASLQRLWQVLGNDAVDALKVQHLVGPRLRVRGPVIAGNLTVATSLIGTAHFPDLSNHIVVLEDVAEPPYKVDRMLTQWALAGVLQKPAAFAFGTFNPTPNPATYEVIVERTERLGVPIYTCPYIGHHGEVAALKLGTQTTLQGSTLR